MKLIKIVKYLSLEPYEENKYSCPFFEWFLYNLYFEKEHNLYPTLWFVKQEPSYLFWEVNCKFLMNINYKYLVEYDNRFRLFKDMKKWLIDSIKRNYVAGLDPI